ncbi:type 1 glutamine amidotransferase [Cohnella nanjingensis]|uniref:type 1 glutamine amidotransferase n=1 Tax=Cohnella nanjingensis TaxID=1387779 RepID=UPI0035E4238A
MEGLPEKFHSFHWHKDAVSLPEGAVRLAESDATDVQAFACGNRVLGLQFHLETTPACMETMLDLWRGELTDAPHIRSAARIAGEAGRPNPDGCCGSSWTVSNPRRTGRIRRFDPLSLRICYRAAGDELWGRDAACIGQLERSASPPAPCSCSLTDIGRRR